MPLGNESKGQYHNTNYSGKCYTPRIQFFAPPTFSNDTDLNNTQQMCQESRRFHKHMARWAYM